MLLARASCVLFAVAALSPCAQAQSEFDERVLPVLQSYCLDCHYDGEAPEGGLNLERFRDEADVMADRKIWKSVFDKVESKQMPPPKEASLPTGQERQILLDWIASVAARPDPQLGVRDPGKPTLRRLTRLEYNNTVRDLFQLDTDVFMFPERLPLTNKNYFQPATKRLEGPLVVKTREYGAKHPVLLPVSGLPGDNRAEHGYRNRGDAMNVSPLLLEKYVALAGEIVQHPDLPRRSEVFAGLLGVTRSSPAAANNEKGAVSIVRQFAPQGKQLKSAERNPDWPAAFREEVAAAFEEARGGVFDVPAPLANQTIAGKGGLIKAAFGGGKLLTINPSADLWLVSFATAEETSGSLLIANKNKGEKVYELTFDIVEGDEDEEITRLGVCVLGRKGASGEVTLVAAFSDGTEDSRPAMVAEGPDGTTFFSFAAHPGESIRRLKVDGSQFSGDFVLIDDLGFITDGRAAKGGGQATRRKDGRIAAREASPPRERLAEFLARAFRRPVAEAEIDRYFALYESARASGQSGADAMRVAVQAVLSSPSFLYISESQSHASISSSPHRSTSPPASVRPLTDFEFASRLSYFLWSSMPDEEILALAAAGKLQDEATLQAQTERMLRDVKARELSESFAVQWLRLDQLYTAKPDRQLFKSFYSGPQGKGTLHASQLIEALLLFETALIEDRSILDFLDADYTWVNPRLASLYQLEAAAETADNDAASGQQTRELKLEERDSDHLWRRVPLSDDVRGGYLTMSAPLTVTSLPFRTSPVKRGAWLLETIFNRPPTEPKVAFAIENDTKQSAEAQSVRARFEAHRNQAACYTCHVRLDPPGFALEQFDAIGAWRESDGGEPVDAGGEWNGVAFHGPAEFKALLRSDPHEFTRGFIEHLLSYALGRELEISDMPTVAEIERSARDHNYRLHHILTQIVASYPFRFTSALP